MNGLKLQPSRMKIMAAADQEEEGTNMMLHDAVRERLTVQAFHEASNLGNRVTTLSGTSSMNSYFHPHLPDNMFVCLLRNQTKLLCSFHCGLLPTLVRIYVKAVMIHRGAPKPDPGVR